MKQFHPLTVAEVVPITEDSVRIVFAIPDEFREEYRFLPGQHLAFQITVNGKKYRRTYSICSGIDEPQLAIGVRVQTGGHFSEFAAHDLRVGDIVEAMPPSGQFHVNLDRYNARSYVGIAAGSGITPILSMIKSVLAHEPNSRFVLFYANRNMASTMFIDELRALTEQNPDRFHLYLVFSREDHPAAVASGRLDAVLVPQLMRRYCADMDIADVFLCGPESMTEDVTRVLLDMGMDEAIVHSERFGPPRRGRDASVTAAAPHQATITVVMDGREKRFDMHPEDSNIVDAAARQGIDLPFSCKDGLCATCKCFIREGEISMARQYGLEPRELDEGYALACQSRPVSDTVVLDFDKA